MGVVSIMCKGAKTLKSPFRATTLRFTYAKFIVYYKEDKLSLLKSVDTINNLNNIKNNIVLLSYLNYKTELTLQVSKQTLSNLYDMYITTILKIEEGIDALVLTNILEIKYLDFLGVAFDFNSCVECGSNNNIITIDVDKGGYICTNCYQNEPIVDAKTIQFIRKYYYIDIKSIKNINISSKIKEEINNFLDRYYERYTGLYLNSKQFLKKIRD